MNKVDEAFVDLLKMKGYSIFGNKKISPNPIIMVHTDMLNKAEKCDADELYQQIINFCTAQIKKK